MGRRRMDTSQMDNSSEDVPAAGVWPSPRAQTGDPAVDAALSALEAVPGLPVSGHHAVYTALHDSLLAELNAEQSEER